MEYFHLGGRGTQGFARQKNIPQGRQGSFFISER